VVPFASTAPLFSIIIPAFGRPERLRALLGEVLAQATSEEFEVIVVDDGSPEPLEPLVRDLFDNAATTLRILRQSNGGPSVARNAGAAAARGTYLLFIDDDLSIPRNLVQTHLELQQAFGPALINCALEWRIEAEPEPFAAWYRERTTDWGRSRTDEGTRVADGVLEITAPSASTANLSLPRADFERLNGFDPGYPYGCEDQDLAGRADRLGLRILFTTRVTAIHVETHNTLPKLCRRQRMGARDTVRFLKRFAVEHHLGLPDIALHNDPIAWRRDGPALAAKKSLRGFLALPLVAPLAFGLIGLAGRVLPRSRRLARSYEIMVGAFAQKGWREGLRRHRDVEPLDDWKPGGARKPLPSAK
jgi:glycosyltransferase involved in cell wall biosynthesis